MVYTAVIADEAHKRKQALTFLHQQARDELQIHPFDGKDAIKHPGSLDIAFLDSRLVSESGLKTAAHLRRHDPHLVLVWVAEDVREFAKGRNADPDAYVLWKDLEIFIQTAMPVLLQRSAQKKAACIQLTAHNRKVWLKKADIRTIERNRRQLTFFTTSDPSMTTVYGSMDQILEQLGDPFIRVHSSWAVQKNLVRTCSREQVEMDDGTIVPVSRKYLDSVREALYA